MILILLVTCKGLLCFMSFYFYQIFSKHLNAIYLRMVFLLETVQVESTVFYFLFTIVMKVLISCTENPNIFIEVLDELELFIDEKVIFDEKKISVGVRRLPSVNKFCNPHNFFSLQP
jgi:hypothetical protein